MPTNQHEQKEQDKVGKSAFAGSTTAAIHLTRHNSRSLALPLNQSQQVHCEWQRAYGNMATRITK